MSGPDCAVGLLVDLSEPSPEPVKTPKRRKTPRQNGKKSPANADLKRESTDTKENATPASAVSIGLRRGSITLREAADPAARVLADVTDKNTTNRSVDSEAITPLDDERFDFDFVGSPAIPVKENTEDDDEEVFFGPVTFSEKCTMASLKSEKDIKPLSPVTSSQMAEIVKEAHTIAHQIASMMSTSESESEHSRSDRNSYSSPIARWKAGKRTPKKDESRTPKRADSTPGLENRPAAKTPQVNMENTNTEGSGCRSSARLRRSATFTIKDRKPESQPDAIKQSLQFTEGDGASADHVKSEKPECHVREDLTVAVNKPDPDKEMENKPSRGRQSNSNGIPKPSGLKRPSRMPVPGNRSIKRSSSSESQASCHSMASRQDSFGSEGTADNCSIGSDISDISNASTASNMSTSSRGTKLAIPKSRLSGAGVPRPGSKIDTGLGLKRPSLGANRSLQANKPGPVIGKGPLKACPMPQGLNRSLQMPAVTSKIASTGKERIKSGPVPGRAPNRMSLGTSPSVSLRGRTPKTETETTKNPTPLSSAKPVVARRVSTGPLTRQALTRPGDIQHKTFAVNRGKQTPTVSGTGPVKATGIAVGKGNPTPKVHPGVKRAVETPVKPNKSVQPKKLSLSSSFDSPSRNNSTNSHVAASTPRSSSKAANRRSFLPTPTKTMRLVSGGSNGHSSPVSFRGVSTSSTKSCGSSLRCDSDSVFETSDAR